MSSAGLRKRSHKAKRKHDQGQVQCHDIQSQECDAFDNDSRNKRPRGSAPLQLLCPSTGRVLPEMVSPSMRAYAHATASLFNEPLGEELVDALNATVVDDLNGALPRNATVGYICFAGAWTIGSSTQQRKEHSEHRQRIRDIKDVENVARGLDAVSLRCRRGESCSLVEAIASPHYEHVGTYTMRNCLQGESIRYGDIKQRLYSKVLVHTNRWTVEFYRQCVCDSHIDGTLSSLEHTNVVAFEELHVWPAIRKLGEQLAELAVGVHPLVSRQNVRSITRELASLCCSAEASRIEDARAKAERQTALLRMLTEHVCNGHRQSHAQIQKMLCQIKTYAEDLIDLLCNRPPELERALEDVNKVLPNHTVQDALIYLEQLVACNLQDNADASGASDSTLRHCQVAKLCDVLGVVPYGWDQRWHEEWTNLQRMMRRSKAHTNATGARASNWLCSACDQALSSYALRETSALWHLPCLVTLEREPSHLGCTLHLLTLPPLPRELGYGNQALHSYALESQHASGGRVSGMHPRMEAVLRFASAFRSLVEFDVFPTQRVGVDLARQVCVSVLSEIDTITQLLRRMAASVPGSEHLDLLTQTLLDSEGPCKGAIVRAATNLRTFTPEMMQADFRAFTACDSLDQDVYSPHCHVTSALRFFVRQGMYLRHGLNNGGAYDMSLIGRDEQSAAVLHGVSICILAVLKRRMYVNTQVGTPPCLRLSDYFPTQLHCGRGSDSERILHSPSVNRVKLLSLGNSRDVCQSQANKPFPSPSKTMAAFAGGVHGRCNVLELFQKDAPAARWLMANSHRKGGRDTPARNIGSGKRTTGEGQQVGQKEVPQLGELHCLECSLYAAMQYPVALLAQCI